MARSGEFSVAIVTPFTRAWCVERFFRALGESDVPLSDSAFIAYVDSRDPDLRDAVTEGALSLPFAHVAVQFSAWEPPHDKAKASQRRWRHAAMRCGTAGLTPDAEHLLLLEDDTLIPRKTWGKLMAAREAGYDWVSGYEVGRWNIKCPGVWRIHEHTATAPKPGTGLEPVSATGLYCVLTTPDLYRMVRWDAWDDSYGHDVSTTYALTQAGYRLGVDWSVRCVHMTPEGDITWRHGRAFSREVGTVRRQIMTGDGFMSFDDEKEYPERKGGVTIMNPQSPRGKVYYAPHRIVVDGAIKYSKKAPIPWDEAVELAKAGIISDPKLNAELFEPRTDIKPDAPTDVKSGLITPPMTSDGRTPRNGEPSEAEERLNAVRNDEGGSMTFLCRVCGKPYKTEAGRDKHEADKHA